MSITQLKRHLVDRIDTADERLLRTIYVMMEAYYDEEQGYDINGQAHNISDLRKQLEQEYKSAKSGNFTRLDELKEKSEQWLNNTK